MWCIKIFSLVLIGSETDDYWRTVEKASWIGLFLSIVLAFMFFGFFSPFAWFYCAMGLFLYWWLASVDAPEPHGGEPEHQEPPLPGNELPRVVTRQFLIYG